MTLLAVGPSARPFGVDAPGYCGHTYDWREPRGSAANTKGIEALFRVMDVTAALREHHVTDAHFVTYIVRGPDGAPLGRQPRVNKGGIAWLREQGYSVETHAFAADLDTPGHVDWTPEYMGETLEQLRRAPSLDTCGLYFSARGWRVVQPLETPIPSDAAEAPLRRWLLRLTREGLSPDMKCKDWTRFFRVPHGRRPEYRTWRTPDPWLDEMRAIAVEVTADDVCEEPRPAAPTAPVAFEVSAPPGWEARVATMAAAVRAVETEWHSLFLALAGALVRRGVAAEFVPAIVGAVSVATGADSKTASRIAGAQTTVSRARAGMPCKGLRELSIQWPDVAAAVVAVTARGREAELRAVAPAAPAPPAAESAEGLYRTVLDAPDGVTLVSAECGLGKTTAAIAVAMVRAEKGYARPDAKGTRAPAQSKTGISVDKNDLAVQVVEDVRRHGGRALRVFGPLSLKGADGQPVCRLYDAAAAIQGGGQSVPWEFCVGREKSPCEYRDSCPAADGMDGPSNARIVVGPHALLGVVAQRAGATGLLVVDEPPSILESTTVSLEDLKTAAANVEAFESRFGELVRPILDALTVWLRELAPVEVPHALEEIVRAGADVLGPDDLGRARLMAGGVALNDVAEEAIACAREARPGQAGAPPLKFSESQRARRSVSFAREVGAASKVLRAIQRSLTPGAPVVWRVDEPPSGRVLVVTEPHEGFVAALRREGATVITDANAGLHHPVIAKVVGYDPPLHRFTAADGAPVARTLLRCSHANRKGWFSHGRPVLGAGVVSALRSAVAWVLEDSTARSVGLITYMAVRHCLEVAYRPEDKAAAEAFRAAGLPVKLLHEARELLAPVLSGLPFELRFGHYQATRGLNAMAECDALVTLGDPWPNLVQARNDAAYLGLEEWETRFEAMARAELEQAHGRLRTVHRTRPARALHVGNVRPGGSGWGGKIELRFMEGGRPRNAAAMGPGDLAAVVHAVGGPGKASAALGCGRATLARYLSGERAIPAGVAAEVRKIAAETSAAFVRPSMSPKPLTKNTILVRGFGDVAIGVSETRLRAAPANDVPAHEGAAE